MRELERQSVFLRIGQGVIGEGARTSNGYRHEERCFQNNTSVSFLFFNFLMWWEVKNMWETFRKYGNLVDIYMAQNRLRNGCWKFSAIVGIGLYLEMGLESMIMEQYLTHTDYALWEVIVNGDAPAVALASAEGPIHPKTAEQKLARKNELKGKSTLLLAILDEHLLKFHGIKDAKTL
ncbi:hypothetical protein Tco_0946878 [Tanacetum coccineum]